MRQPENQFWMQLAACFLVVALAACKGAPVSDGAASISPAPPSLAVPYALVKLVTTDPGYYSVAVDEVRKLGLQIESFDPDTTTLYGNGIETDYWIEGAGRKSTLGFFATGTDNRYLSGNVYWLGFGRASVPGMDACRTGQKPVVEGGENSDIPLPDGSYAATVQYEDNRIYQPQAESAEHWFSASLPAPQNLTLEVALENLDTRGEMAHLALKVWSNTEATASPDHHLVVNINGGKAADETWDGKGWHTVQAVFPASILKEGVNQVQIQAVGDLQIAADIYQIDSLDLTYPRRPVARKDILDFWQPGSALKMDSFSGPVQILDITDLDHISTAGKLVDPGSEFKGEMGRHYYAVGPQGMLKPELALGENSLDLHNNDLSAAYVAIGPHDLVARLQPLLDLRAAQGLKAVAIPAGEIYDQFSCGVPDPVAIQRFMRHAAQAWSEPPQFLLLVGDATYDPRGYITRPEANRLPTFLVDTVFGGETASDVDYVQLNDDPWPDLPVGRLPASTPEQVDIIVQKILRYEKGTSRSNRLVAIADGQEPSFRGDAQAFLDLFPGDYERELFAPDAGDSTASQKITQLIAGSNLLVAYFGHGSLNMWGKDQLFTTEDVNALPQANQFPVVVNLTCLTGLFTHPKVESLAEALLWKADGGAVAVLAPSSLTLPTDQSFLSRPLAQALIDEPGATLGELHLRARRQVSVDAAGALDVMETFMLFGDPALHLAIQVP